MPAKSGKEGPAVIEADKLVGKSNDQIEATGNATISQGGKSIRADTLLFNQHTHELDARGSVMLKQDGTTMSGPHLMLNLDKNSGTMEQPQYYLKENNARGSADKLQIQDRLHYTLDNASYTTCPAGNQDWELSMGLLKIDRDRQVGVAHNALVEFKGVPILYSPWMDFPLNNQRKSGFLAPIFGGTSTGGSEITLPFYWNIAPNFDATIAPREMSKRGLMLNNEFRYLEPGFHGTLEADVLPNDKITQTTRSFVSLKHDQTLGKYLNGFLNYSRVGDDNYFRDLGSAISTTSQVNLLQEGGVSYGGDWWDGMARVQHYQTLQDPAAPIVVPYARAPQLTLNARQNYAGANIGFSGEIVDFTHPTLVNATRLVVNPSVSYPLVSTPAYYVTPKVSLHSAYYAMGANNTGTVTDMSSTLPIFSLDSGIALEREGKMFGSGYIQTLEPRAFYVYIPYKDQSQLPNFDTVQADFSFAQMFMENRFFGNDRVGDANQLTLALTSRMLEQQSGAERLKMLIGERVSFTAPQVNLVAPATTTNKSDILLALSGRISSRWSLDGELQFDPNQSQVQHYNGAVHYRPEPGKVLNFGYRFSRGTYGALIPGGVPVTPTGYTTLNGITYPTIGGVPYTLIGGVPYAVDTGGLRQVDISSQWPIYGRWFGVGRWNYSLQDSRILEAIGGLEYNQDCWLLRLVAQRFATATQQSNTGFFVQLELNDFVKVGSDPLDLLKQSVPGYTKLNDKAAIQSPQEMP
ncbi:MAG: LPS-assembly protein LptD [Gallionella sp.]|nr:LPS-assembly protein LptD [Gallionella sp.]